MTRSEAPDLASALCVGRGDLASLVGGGGKTTAMYRLAADLKGKGIRVAAATTTKIAPPTEKDGAALVLAAEWSELRDRLAAWDWTGPVPALADGLLSTEKVKGLPPSWCDRLLAEGLVEALVVEADGAARRPVKAPEEWEPVVPEGTTRFVEVLGLSCVGRPLADDVAFRIPRICAATGLAAGDLLTPAALARLLMSARGLLKGCPPGAQLTVLLNQADLPGARESGRLIAEQALQVWPAPERVVVASLLDARAQIEFWEL